MDLSFEAIAVQLGFDQRYGPPPMERFQQLHGPYRREHKFDRVLEREVELCTEYDDVALIRSCRGDFIKEAKIGGLCHPNLVPVYDFGMTSDGLFYFTRPLISGTGLQRFFEHCLLLDGWRVLYENLITSSLHRFAAEDIEYCRQEVSAQLQWLEDHGFIQRTVRPALLKQQLSVPADTDGLYSSMETKLADHDRRFSDRSITGSELDEFLITVKRKRIIDSRKAAFRSLVAATLRYNHVSIEKLATSEGVVQLCLSRFVEVVLAACRGVDHAHRHGIWHLHLYPDAILVGDAGGEVYVTEWRLAHCQGTAPPTIWVGVPRQDRDTWCCRPPEAEPNSAKLGPAFDVFALGGVLSFILHESSPILVTENKTSSRFREAIVPLTDPPSNNTREFAQDLEQVCLRALRADPKERYPQVNDFAAALTGCIKRARLNGMAS